jgi:tetratricopeptide (TPR) repeat protein
MTRRPDTGKASAGLQGSTPSFLDKLEERRFKLLAFAVVAALAAAAYANSLYGDFVFDDVTIIKTNESITRVGNIPALFFTEYWESLRNPNEEFQRTFGLYRPLVMVTYALNYAVTELSPWGYHLVNVLLHLIVTWILFLLALQLGLSRGASLVAASLFAAHPIHVEAVTGIVGRAELLMAFGVLAGLWWAIQNKMGLSIAAFAIGLFSKEQAVLLPAIVLLYDFSLGNMSRVRLRWREWKTFVMMILRRHAGYAIALAVYLVVRFITLPLAIIPRSTYTRLLTNPLGVADPYTRILTSAKVAWRYVWLCIWPASLSADYSYNSVPVTNSITEPEVLLGILFWGGLLILAVRSWKGDRRILFAVGLTVLAYLPTSNLLVLVAIMAERFFYLPSAGLFLLAGLGWEALERRTMGRRENAPAHVRALDSWFRVARLGGVALFSAACLALTARTIVRNRDWQTTETLFAKVREVFPENIKAILYFGTLAGERAEWDESYKLFHTALRIRPDLVERDAIFNRRYGKLLMDSGKVEESLGYLERAAKLQPKLSLSYYNLGLAYGRVGRYPEAEAALKRSLELNPEAPDTYNTLSRLYIELARWEEAVEAADQSIKRRPEFPWAHFNRAWALEKSGRMEEALASYEKAYSLEGRADVIKKKVDDLRVSLRKASSS